MFTHSFFLLRLEYKLGLDSALAQKPRELFKFARFPSSGKFGSENAFQPKLKDDVETLGKFD